MDQARESAKVIGELLNRRADAGAARMGTVTALLGGMAQVRFSDADAAGNEWYASLAGFQLETGDIVAMIPFDRSYLILGRVQTTAPIRAILPAHVYRAGDTPTIAVAAALGSGGSLGATITGTDSAGIIQLTAGASGTATGIVATITFDEAMLNSNYSVQLRAYSNAARALTTEVSAATRATGSWQIQTNTAFTAGGVYQWLYTIDGYRAGV